MLNRDFAGTTARIASTTNITPVEQVDYANALKTFLDEYRTSSDRYEKAQDKALAKSKADALTNALKGGNQDEINNALASVDPVSYAQMLKSDAQRAEDRKWALDDAATKHRYDLELAKAKDKEFTTAQRNMAYLQEMGYSPKEAAMLVYGGQNPSLDMAMLNSKGQDAHDKKIGEHLAEEQIKQDKMRQNDERLNSVITHIEDNPSTVGMYAPLKTAVARALGGLGDKEWLNKRGYSSRALGEIQNNLIAEAKMSGQSGINTAREIEQATKGLNEILGALSAMQDSISRLRKQQKTPSLKSVNNNGTDPFGIR